MKKVDLNYSDINLDQIVLNIKNDSVGKAIVEKLQLTDNDIILYYELLNNYISINKSCENCKSMKDCTHSTKGHKYGLKVDDFGDLTDYFTICSFYQDYYTKKKNLIYSTFDTEDVLDENQKRFILDNPSLLGLDNIKKIVAIQTNTSKSGVYLKVNNSKIRLKLIKSLAYNLLKNHKVSIVKFSDLLKTIKSEFKIKEQDTFKILLDSEILIIDGLGNEAITAWSRDEILLSLLDNRLQSDKTTILCSEYSIEDLKKLYKLGYNDDAKANQLIDKIKEICN